MTAWSIPALGMLQTDKTNKQLAICLGSELGKPWGQMPMQTRLVKRAEGSWEMGPGDLAKYSSYISFFYEEVSRQIGN